MFYMRFSTHNIIVLCLEDQGVILNDDLIEFLFGKKQPSSTIEK